MAKKVKKKVSEGEKEFHFPHFDVRGFILHELEQSYATAFSLCFALLLGLASWQITRYGLSSSIGVAPFTGACFALGIVCAFLLIRVIRQFRPSHPEYRRGDWAGLVALYVLGWLGFWTLFLNF